MFRNRSQTDDLCFLIESPRSLVRSESWTAPSRKVIIVGCITEWSVVQSRTKVAHDWINPRCDSYLLTRVHDYHYQLIIEARYWTLKWITNEANWPSVAVVLGSPNLTQLRPRLAQSNQPECAPKWDPKRSLAQEGPCLNLIVAPKTTSKKGSR